MISAKKLAQQLQEKYVIVLAGKINDPAYHKCHACLRYLEQEHPYTINVIYQPFFET